MTPYPVALSSEPGRLRLNIPPHGGGEASLRELETTFASVEVEVRTLDSYELKNVGFIKIDVEGFEESLIEGAWETIKRWKPRIFVEIEERHNPGGVQRVHDRLASLGYRAQFMLSGALRPYEEFDVSAHQLGVPPSSPTYGNNFLFGAD